MESHLSRDVPRLEINFLAKRVRLSAVSAETEESRREGQEGAGATSAPALAVSFMRRGRHRQVGGNNTVRRTMRGAS